MNGTVKILRIEFSEVAIFQKGFTVDFIATDRVYRDTLLNIQSSIYTQNVMSFIGVNASGKTTVLNLLNFAMSYVLKGMDLSDIDIPLGLFRNPVQVTVYFYFNEKIYCLESTIECAKKDDQPCYLYFAEETLISKPINSVRNRKNLFEFSSARNSDNVIIQIRSQLGKQERQFLKGDTSIIFPYTNEFKTYLNHSLYETNINVFRTLGSTPKPVTNLFDDSIEYIEGENNSKPSGEFTETWKLKFRNEDTIHQFFDPVDLGKVLSSGTIRGNNMFSQIISCLVYGGYFIVDELENHFNKKLVEVIINLFMDTTINRNGATLLFSTHYTELLDTLDRKDNIFVCTRDSSFSASVVKYSDAIKRNDVKKSDVILSNRIGGTAPKYQYVHAMKELAKAIVESDDELE